MGQAHVNEGYELYQIITDFGDPLEIFREGIQNSFDADATNIYIRVFEEAHLSGKKLIIELIDNGHGIKKENVNVFFDIANSTKVNSAFLPAGNKHGYKGHGSKVFFNAEQVTICSKTKDGEYWAASLDNPLDQIGVKGILEYSEPCDDPSLKNISLPEDWESGFIVRITSPKLFLTQHTHAQLNHKILRDYINWYTIFGTVETAYNDELKNKGVKLYLCGLNLESFKNSYNSIEICDPVPVITHDTGYNCDFEIVPLGHYFPPERKGETELRKYTDSIKSTKAWFDYYSRMVYNNNVVEGGISFRLIINIEGYEAKRRYDLLLSRRGVANEEGTHTDASRYGLWACKGGVPVEKVDDWIEGGRGVGTYTYMQAFVDCDEFQLTANRGSIRNTDIEKLDLIKRGINRILSDSKVSAAIRERAEIEEFERSMMSIDEDRTALEKRYKSACSRKEITLPNGRKLLEPTKTGKNSYNESKTFALLVEVIENYPNLFPFQILDYNTTKGIDFVIDHNGSPKYIELKGMLTKKINHPFRYLYKFICYDIDVKKNETVEDLEFKTTLVVNNNDSFDSPDINYKGKKYTSYVLQPATATIQSMEIIKLKTFLTEVLGATIG
ncbi:MAG: ATP-binding protein [Lachnospiraceae bacterium]|nr:ATP-binding protein [Lachnospiraceae bacterium]